MDVPGGVSELERNLWIPARNLQIPQVPGPPALARPQNALAAVARGGSPRLCGTGTPTPPSPLPCYLPSPVRLCGLRLPHASCLALCPQYSQGVSMLREKYAPVHTQNANAL